MRRPGEWVCKCKEANIRSQSCLKCLKCGMDKPAPVKLHHVAPALERFFAVRAQGGTPLDAMRAALEFYEERRG